MERKVYKVNIYHEKTGMFKAQMKIEDTDFNSGRITSNDWYFIITKGEFTKSSNNFKYVGTSITKFHRMWRKNGFN